MSDNSFTVLYKLRYLLGSALIVASLILLSFILSVISANSKVLAKTSDNSSVNSTYNTEDNPNVVAVGMDKAVNGITNVTASAQQTLNSSLRGATTTVMAAATQSGKVVAHGASVGASAAVRGVGSGASAVVNGVSSAAGFVAHSTGKVFGVVADAPGISNVIRPADNTKVPVIDSEYAAKEVVQPSPQAPTQPTSQPKPQLDSSTQWPLHGTVTTEFGASDWPYQRYHTGIDISDGNRSGTTPIKPFKAGKVVQVIHSSVSLGNHVVVDNGGGITSVYGHMYKTNVQVGQQVDKNSILGWEGSTGASTGPHLHFEIYLNGALQNPHQYIAGQP